jgi:1-acyl-sn-glycerol-3-phosphate acyltransferase
MLSEMMIKSGDGSKMVQEMVDRLKFGDIVNIFPEGTFPAYVYQNSGLVQEGFTGAARVALEYEKQTGKPLTIVPVGSLGANYAYPPKEKTKRYPTAKIKVMIGKPFTLNWNDVKKFDKEEVNQNCEIIQHKIMHLVGQKKLIPNYYRRWASKQKPEKRSY